MSARGSGDPILIFLRHAPGDRQAIEQFRLQLQGLLTARDPRVILTYEASGDTGGVAFLSPEFLESGQISSLFDEPVPSVPFVLQPCEWQQFSFLAPRILPANGQPFSTLPPDGQRQALDQLAAACLQSFVPDRPLSLSPEAHAVFDLANRLARAKAARDEELSTSCLLFAFLERGRLVPTPKKVPQTLFDLVDRERYQAVLSAQFPHLSGVPPTVAPVERRSPTTEKVLQDATRIALATSGSEEVHARHLVAALLSQLTPNADRRFRDAGGNPDTAIRHLRDFIRRTFPNESGPAWKDAFLAVDPAPPTSRSTYSNDSTRGDDLLNIRKDVHALASLIAARAVAPPLSIGLFGDWGSGKSFFMGKLRERIFDIASKSKESASEYHGNIVQVEFNAWHYMEGDLAASLVEHIFSNLSMAREEPKETLQKRRDQLLEQLLFSEGEQQTAAARLQALRTRIAESEKARADLQAKLTLENTQLTAILLNKVKSRIPKELGAALDALPMPAGTRASIDAMQDDLKLLAATAGSARAQGRLLWREPARLRHLAFWLGGGLVAAGLVWAVQEWLRDHTHDVAWLVSKVGLVLAAVAKPLWQSRSALAVLAKGNRQIDAAFKAVKEEVSGEEKQWSAAISDLSREAEAVDRDLRAQRAEAEKIERQIDDLRAGRLFDNFIRDRAGSADYRKHLGVMALVRRDFEELSSLFHNKRKALADGALAIDRIVLYIDDLDRCPPKQVVKVLQMVHLLLAFDLFIVVVAVDSRWVSRSLEKEYEWLGENGEGAKAHDYLEKIFQVPFWLRRMESDDSQRLLLGLVSRAADAPQPKAKAASANGATPTPTPGPADPVPVPAVAAQQAAAATPEPVDLAAPSLQMTENELTVIARVAGLAGRTPRAAKRFLNSYRLIKARCNDRELDRFLRGPYEPTLQLLAALTGAPEPAAALLRALRAPYANPVEVLKAHARGPLESLQSADAQALAAAAETVALYSFQSPWAENENGPRP